MMLLTTWFYIIYNNQSLKQTKQDQIQIPLRFIQVFIFIQKTNKPTQEKSSQFNL